MPEFNIYPALQIQPNINAGVQSDLSAQTTRIQNQYLPGELQARNQLANTQAQEAQTGYNNQLNAQFLETLNPADPIEANDKWDEYWRGRDAAGDPVAKQYIGKYNEGLWQRLRQSYQPAVAARGAGAGGVGNALGGGTPGLGGLPTGLEGRETSTQSNLAAGNREMIVKQLQALPPDELARKRAFGRAAVNELNHIINTHGDPNQMWNEMMANLSRQGYEKEVQQNMQGGWQSGRPQQMIQQILPILEEMDKVAGSGNGGILPKESFQPTFEKDGRGGIWAVSPDPNSPEGFKRTYVGGGYGQYEGTDQQGRPMGFLPSGEWGRLGDEPLERGRFNTGTNPNMGRTGSGATALQKNAAYLAELAKQGTGIPGVKTEADAVRYLNSGFRDPLKARQLEERIRTDINNDISYINLPPDEKETIVQKRIADMMSSAGGFAGGGAQPSNNNGRLPNSPAPSRAGIPDQAIDYLRKNPNTRAAFDQKYGAGAAARALGQ